MAQTSTVANPFLLMIDPAVVLAAVEKSERLGQLNRHLCRPLDRPVLPVATNAAAGDDAEAGESDEPGESESA